MSVPITTLKAALYDWLTESTGWAVIWQFQNAPEPATPFISVNPVMSLDGIGMFDEAVYDADEHAYAIHAHRRITASIHACGPDALVILAVARDALDLPTRYAEWFSARNLAALPGEIRNLSGLKGARYEQRAQLDLTLTLLNGSGGEPLTDDPGYFDRLDYDSPTLHIPTTTIEGD